MLLWFTDELGVTIDPYRYESVPEVVLESQGVSMHYLTYNIKVSDETIKILKPEFPKTYYNFKEAENKMKSLISN